MVTKAAIAAAANNNNNDEAADDKKPVESLATTTATLESTVAAVTPRSRRERMTEETCSDAHSVLSSDGQYEVIEYDFAADSGSDIFQNVGAVSIQKDSPAAAALRANAGVHVSSMGKAARAVHMQSVRRVLKRAAGKPKSGNKKGKPPRVPPKLLLSSSTVSPTYQQHHPYNEDNSLLEDDDESDDDEEEDDYSSESSHNQSQSSEEDKISLESDNENRRNKVKEQTQLDREAMHIPDGVTPGTVEAGKKGKCILNEG